MFSNQKRAAGGQGAGGRPGLDIILFFYPFQINIPQEKEKHCRVHKGGQDGSNRAPRCMLGPHAGWGG